MFKDTHKELREYNYTPTAQNARQEIWKDVVGYEGLYEISNLGSIRNFKTKAIKKTIICKNGYRRVSVSKNCHHKIKCMHRIIAEAFIPNPENKPQVNHKNGIRTDNSIENLEWMTAKENIRHSYSRLNKLASHAKGVDCDRSKNIYQYTVLGEFVKMHFGLSEASLCSGISKSLIFFCCSSDHYNVTGGGFVWSYDELSKNEVLNKLSMRRNAKRKSVIQYLGMCPIAKYRSLTEAGQLSGLSRNSILLCVTGKIKLTKGHSFRYV